MYSHDHHHQRSRGGHRAPRLRERAVIQAEFAGVQADLRRVCGESMAILLAARAEGRGPDIPPSVLRRREEAALLTARLRALYWEAAYERTVRRDLDRGFSRPGTGVIISPTRRRRSRKKPWKAWGRIAGGVLLVGILAGFVACWSSGGITAVEPKRKSAVGRAGGR